jgi:hypothetical protein
MIFIAFYAQLALPVFVYHNTAAHTAITTGCFKRSTHNFLLVVKREIVNRRVSAKPATFNSR